MPIYFHRLENALKRANEFIDVGKKPRALEILCDVLRSRKHRTWQKKHEDIMIKYLELCVELKKSYVAKEGIYQYKIICQQTYINSFEEVVRKYLEMAEEKANTAKEESQASQAVLDIDDLDYVQTPEDILLSAVSNEDTQDRTDRVVLIPWVKFLWESYRQCLDLLKNNCRTERLYHEIANKAFGFCIKYNRKTEFRKLCDNLHAHLDILKKQQQQQQTGHQQQNAINLNNAESQAMHLETRLCQLDCAIQMELWQEAYKATDDIKKFGLMNLSKKPPKPQLMASYYQKLALVFWKANCPLFHSAALFRLFHLSKELRKNITPEDIQKMATKVVASTIAIPIPPNRPEIDKLVDTEENIIESHQRNLASLLGLTIVPTRASLIKDLKRLDVLQHAYVPFQDLYRWLEIDFHPLVLCNRVQQVIDYIEKCTECPDLKQYINSLKDVTIMRLLKTVSQVYQTIEFKRLLELCPFATFTHLEKMVVEAARRNDLQVRIDHRKGCLIFGTELRVSLGEELIEGPHLQSMPSEQIRRQLVNMFSTLQKARNLIEPDRIKLQRDDIKKKIMKAYKHTAIEEHQRILNRQGIIEERKEQLEQLGIRREEEERKKVEEQQQRLREAEEERILKENEERERQRKLKQDIELKKQMAMDQISLIKGSLAGNLLENLDDEELAKLKPEDIHSRRIEQLEKERRDQLAKQRKLERKIDHLERAKRIEEIPLLQKAYEEWRVNDEQLWEEMEKERIKEMKAERIFALEHRERFLRVLDEKNVFSKQILDKRHATYDSQLEKFMQVYNAEKLRRLEARKQQRKEDRRKQWLTEKEETEKRKKMEAERKAKEESNARLDAIAEKQRQREKEIEEKLSKDKEEGDKRQKEREQSSEVVKPRPVVEEGKWRDEGNWRDRAAQPKNIENEPESYERKLPFSRNRDERPNRDERGFTRSNFGKDNKDLYKDGINKKDERFIRGERDSEFSRDLDRKEDNDKDNRERRDDGFNRDFQNRERKDNRDRDLGMRREFSRVVDKEPRDDREKRDVRERRDDQDFTRRIDRDRDTKDDRDRGFSRGDKDRREDRGFPRTDRDREFTRDRMGDRDFNRDRDRRGDDRAPIRRDTRPPPQSRADDAQDWRKEPKTDDNKNDRDTRDNRDTNTRDTNTRDTNTNSWRSNRDTADKNNFQQRSNREPRKVAASPDERKDKEPMSEGWRTVGGRRR